MRGAAKFLWGGVVLCSVGCGYQFQGGGSVLPAEVKKIYVPRVASVSTNPKIVGLLTDALRDRFDKFGVVQVVDSLEEADAVLEVKLLKSKKGSLTSTSATDRSLQVDNQLTLSGALTRITGQVLWSNPSFTISKSSANARSALITTSAAFSGSGLGAADIVGLSDREVSRSQEQAALATLVDLAAKQVYSEAVAPDF